VSPAVEITVFPFVFLLLLLFLLFFLFFLLLLLFFLLLTLQVSRPWLLVLDEVLGFVEPVAPAIGMCLRFF